MKVIGTGVPKTGTTSLAQALRILGNKTYDFREQMESFTDEWDELFTNGVRPDFKAMFEEVDAVIDTPASFVFEELFECFPDAQVILTIRDNEEVWAKSFREHLEVIPWWAQIYFHLSNRKMHRLVNSINAQMLGSRNPNSSFVHKKRYRWHNERVQQVIPKDKLLVFNVKQGWKPLCEFLGQEVPDEPFPRVNVQGQDLKRIVQDTLKKILLILAFSICGIAVLAIFLKA